MMFPKPEKKKKVNEWEKIRPLLKKNFEKFGIVTCEIKLSGCLINNFLGFAHIDKRIKLKEGELIKAVLACQPCHYKVEYFCKEYTGKTMREFLTEIIQNRG